MSAQTPPARPGRAAPQRAFVRTFARRTAIALARRRKLTTSPGHIDAIAIRCSPSSSFAPSAAHRAQRFAQSFRSTPRHRRDQARCRSAVNGPRGGASVRWLSSRSCPRARPRKPQLASTCSSSMRDERPAWNVLSLVLPAPALLAPTVQAVEADRARRAARGARLAAATRFGLLGIPLEIGLIIGRRSPVPNDDCAHDSLQSCGRRCRSPPWAVAPGRRNVQRSTCVGWINPKQARCQRGADLEVAPQVAARKEVANAANTRGGRERQTPLHRFEETKSSAERCELLAADALTAPFHQFGETSPQR